ncbi:MAG TPA: energy transducer TonB [Pyrinomonadaceae bacterium]|nr:energy transducer TonB [Pyrinomonadaceae bacterium]
MSTSVAKDYVPTIINSRPLLSRLATELSSFEREIKNAWPDFSRHPIKSTIETIRLICKQGSRLLFAPNVLVALATVACILAIALLVDRASRTKHPTGENISEVVSGVTILDLQQFPKQPNDDSIGRDGTGRVGFKQGGGEGSGAIRQRSQGGGSGGDNDPLPPQSGKLPPPSTILASIPKTPPTFPPSLPVAGMDIDPALWKDQKAPVFGDPRSSSNVSSKGPGEEGGIGTNKGLGIGEGDGPGFGPGRNGNTGNGDKQRGCCGEGGANGDGNGWETRILTAKDVEQRAKLISKPEPQYTEEARRNQITGTVMLRVVFSNSGQVEQIRAVQTLPFGLTEKAIAAARQIRFVPAMKSGHPVSVYMQLEYNFNLY